LAFISRKIVNWEEVVIKGSDHNAGRHQKLHNYRALDIQMQKKLRYANKKKGKTESFSPSMKIKQNQKHR
jgi:hypothetical protein